ncbi:MAG TPA: protein kinase [Polyangiaceae bacterium]|nr:protein kinase [Polyangiaceae bacterium]
MALNSTQREAGAGDDHQAPAQAGRQASGFAPADSAEATAYAQALELVGQTLGGKWRLDALIGVGGMAAVYSATHRNGHRAAVKLLHRGFGLSASVRARFLREGYAANGVDHPGVVRVLDDDVLDDGRAYLVMELLTGETLESRWKRRGYRLSAAEVLAVADELLCVLACAHARGITHRDIKPENIFLTDDGRLKVLDFGIAHFRDSLAASVTKTQTGVALGTPAFMAPEQARGRSREVDGRSDLWSVGATLFTLLTGEYVHRADSSNEMLILAATERSRPLASAWPAAPADLCELVDRALAYEKHERWADASVMRRAVRAAQATLGLTHNATVGSGPLAKAGALFVESPTVVTPVEASVLAASTPSFAPPSTAPAAITFIPSMTQIRGGRHRGPRVAALALLALAGAVGPFALHSSGLLGGPEGPGRPAAALHPAVPAEAAPLTCEAASPREGAPAATQVASATPPNGRAPGGAVGSPEPRR